MSKKMIICIVLLVSLFAVYASKKNQAPTTVTETKAPIECKSGCCSPATPVANPLKRSTRPAAAEVYIISPKDGDVVGPEVQVVFGLKGMGVAPAGIDLPDTGHHHLLINVDKLPDLNMPIPANDQHLHFGKGQTETTLKLAPGKHTLQLLLGNFVHIPHDKEVISPKITITVK